MFTHCPERAVQNNTSGSSEDRESPASAEHRFRKFPHFNDEAKIASFNFSGRLLAQAEKIDSLLFAEDK